MHEALSFLLRETASKVIEAAVNRAFEPRAESAPQSLVPPVDPVADALDVVEEFLSALRERDVDLLPHLCEPWWGEHPDTAVLMDATLEAAPPVSWHLRNSHIPGDWVEGEALAWLVADLVVTFDLGNGQYQTIPAVMRAVNGAYGWRIDHLAWETAEPEPQEAASPFEEFFANPTVEYELVEEAPAKVVVACRKCGQRMRVPSDKGRLRFKCAKCGSRQTYQP